MGSSSSSLRAEQEPLLPAGDAEQPAATQTTAQGDAAPVQDEHWLPKERIQSRLSNDSAAGLSWLDTSKNAQLVRYGAYLFMWVIGTVALIKLLTDFSSALKPLVLAALVASILEWLVQFWEFFLWKVANFLTLIVHKLFDLVCITFIYLCGALRGLLQCCCCADAAKKAATRRRTHLFGQKYINDLRDWSSLCRRWHSSYAGHNTMLRFIAVFLTLIVVTALLVLLYALIMSNASYMLGRLNGYKDQMIKVLAYTRAHLDELPKMMPRDYQNQTRDALNRVESYLGAESMVHRFEAYISEILEGLVEQTESVAVGAVFFFLYLFLWLFVPIHLNSHENRAKTFTVVPWRSKTRLPRGGQREAGEASQPPMQRSSSFVPGDEVVLNEMQERLYKVIREYFLAMVIINAIYAVAVMALLVCFHVDMSTFIAIACFFLGFIPELGTIISTLLPIVLVVFEPLRQDEAPTPGDQRRIFESPFVDWSTRSIKIWQVLMGMIAIKLLVANVLTSIVMGKNQTLSGAVLGAGDPSAGKVKETPPVIILFFVVLSGEIWGVVGMLISVPVVSLVRLAMNIWFLESHSHCKEE